MIFMMASDRSLNPSIFILIGIYYFCRNGWNDHTSGTWAECPGDILTPENEGCQSRQHNYNNWPEWGRIADHELRTGRQD